MEHAGTSEEDDDIDSQDSNTPIDHGNLARNCSINNLNEYVSNISALPGLANYFSIVSRLDMENSLTKVAFKCTGNGENIAYC